jgi:hypothetical protein
MRQVLYSLGAAILLFLASVAGTNTYLKATQPEYFGIITLQQEENYREKYKAWFQACDYSPYTCIGVVPPKVVSEYMRYGLLGYYQGDDTVYINRRLRGQELNEVLMHEMIHYLQAKVGGLPVPGPANLICQAEEEAFTLVDQWLLDHGYGDLRVGPEWWKPYDHCWRWYGPDWMRNAIEEDDDWHYTH